MEEIKLIQFEEVRYTHRNPATGEWWDDIYGEWVNPDKLKEKKDGSGKHENR